MGTAAFNQKNTPEITSSEVNIQDRVLGLLISQDPGLSSRMLGRIRMLGILGRLGMMERMGRVGRMGRMGILGRLGRMGKLGRLGRMGRMQPHA